MVSESTLSSMSWLVLFLVFLSPCIVYGNITLIIGDGTEERRTGTLVDLITFNQKRNAWANIICVGSDLPDSFYGRIGQLPYTIVALKPGDNTHDIDDVVPYHSNVIVLECMDFDAFEDNLRKAMASPYWHPHANIIVYYHVKEMDDIPKIFMVFWFYKACNAIVVQYDDIKEVLLVSTYNTYITEWYRMPNEFGCWKVTKLARPPLKFTKAFICEEGCHNITLHSRIKIFHLGTCVGFKTDTITYGDSETLKKMELFQDKSKDLHGVVLRAHGTEVEPFTKIEDHGNGSYSLYARDGMIWNVMAEFMNFSIDLAASKDVLKKPFNFEINIQQIYTFAQGQADLLIFPVYLFDIIIVEVDMSIAYKDSGVCIMSHRADYETVLFDAKLVEKNSNLFIRFFVCILCIWLTFFIFNSMERGASLELVGRSLLNTVRNALSISLHNPPRQSSFKIFLAVSIWCFFVINFATQAAIISFFAAYKRGKDVDTFEEIIEKGYTIEGMASPDMMLPDTEERFLTMNSRLVSLNNLFECVNRMTNDSRRFCLIDCAVGRYIENNRLNEKGEQYLHMATKDRIHSHYLTMILHKNSPLTRTFNKCLRMCFEAGLIKKWEQYRYSYLKEEVPLKPLNIDDLIGIFKGHYFFLGVSSAVFLVEVIIGWLRRFKTYISKKVAQFKKIRAVKKKLKAQRKQGKIKLVNAVTQTV